MKREVTPRMLIDGLRKQKERKEREKERKRERERKIVMTALCL